MANIERKVEIIEGVAPDAIPYDDLIAADRPVILKGLVRDWPLVQRGLESPAAAAAALKRFYNGRPVVCFTAPPEINGQFAYNEDLTGMNFSVSREKLDDCLERILSHLGEPDAPCIYVGSTDLDLFLPGLREENGLALNHPMFADAQLLVSAWIGERSTARAHYDISYNIACCVVGRRRFTLFPPEQIENLYPGPLEPTPGGQVVTMADIHNPDFKRFPRLREALAAAQPIEMEPGDALYYPSLWWHQVDALADFNIMINYWWSITPAFVDTPQNTLLHALLSLRDRPEAEKRAWKAIFDYYVFGPAERAGAHLPDHARGNLGPMDDMKARPLRAYLLQRFNR